MIINRPFIVVVLLVSIIQFTFYQGNKLNTLAGINYTSFVSINQIDSLKQMILFKLQGKWTNEEDSLSMIEVSDANWEFSYVGYENDPDDLYTIEITNKPPQNANYQVYAEFIILYNKSDTLSYELLGITEKTLSIMYLVNGGRALYIKK